MKQWSSVARFRRGCPGASKIELRGRAKVGGVQMAMINRDDSNTLMCIFDMIMYIAAGQGTEEVCFHLSPATVAMSSTWPRAGEWHCVI